MKKHKFVLFMMLALFTACVNNQKNSSENNSLPNDTLTDNEFYQKVSDIIEQDWKKNKTEENTELKKSADGRIITEAYITQRNDDEEPITGMPEYSLDTVFYSDFDQDGKQDALVKAGFTFGSSSLGIMDLYYLFLNTNNGFEYIYKFDNAELALQVISKNGDDYPGRFEFQKTDGNKLSGNAFYWPQYGIANYVTDTVEKMEFTFNKESRQFELSYSSEYVKMERVEE